MEINSSSDNNGVFENDLSQVRATNDYLLNSVKFLQEHNKSLHNIITPGNYKPGNNEFLKSFPSIVAPVENSFDKVLVEDLISPENNNALEKVLFVLVYLCDEIQQLKEIAESKFYCGLLMFGQTPSGVVLEAIPGERERVIGTFLPFLQEISNFVARCCSVAHNLVQQVAALLNDKDPLYRATFKAAQLNTVFSSLGDLFLTLVTLDSLVKSNAILQECWVYYKTMISYIRADPTKFSTTAQDVEKLEKLIVALDQDVMMHEMFSACIEQDYELPFHIDNGSQSPTKPISIRTNQVFLNTLLVNVKYFMGSAVNSSGSGNDVSEKYDVVKSAALYLLYRQLMPSNVPPDVKLFKSMWSIQKIIPFTVLYQSIVWCLSDFLLPCSPVVDLKSLDPPNPNLFRKSFLQQYDLQLSARISGTIAQCTAWMVTAETRINIATPIDAVNINQVVDIRGEVLLRGISLLNRARNLARGYLVIHAATELPSSKATLLDIGHLLEVISAVQYTFERKLSVWMETFSQVVHYLSLNIQMMTRMKVKKLESSLKKLDPSKLDALSLFHTLNRLLESSETITSSRRFIFLLVVELLMSTRLFTDKEAEGLRFAINRLVYFSSLRKDLRAACDLRFLYFHQNILDPVLEQVQGMPTQANRLSYLLQAFSVASSIFKNEYCSIYEQTHPGELFSQLYEEGLCTAVRAIIVQPLCLKIETSLRLSVHTKMANPKLLGEDELKLMRPFLDIHPIKIVSTCLDVRHEVTHYLNMTFYNLTTVALHDWRTYADMRSLAQEKLGVSLMETFLPMGSIADQALDVLQIMRNIHIFVTRFKYDLTMQQFVEFRPDRSSKHLNTIKIQNITASIRQHGLGILNTTVNYTYQFLTQKFNIFSEFLFDDTIRSHLSREYSWFKKNRNNKEVNNVYPHDRAVKLLREIKKLGASEGGKSFLDLFRVLITEIGNALGYVRMVRSASMNSCSEAVKFIPDLENIVEYERLVGNEEPAAAGSEDPNDIYAHVKGANLSAETVTAANHLDSVVGTLLRNFSAGSSDFFKVLVKVFQPALLSDEHLHLQYFHMFVPCLCLSWIDASLQAKDAMLKKTSRTGAAREMYFTDDGFPMGIAYCLAILKQTKKNEGLHFYDTLQSRYNQELSELESKKQSRADKDRAAKEQREKGLKTKKSFFSFSGSSTSKEAAAAASVEPEDEHEDQDEIDALLLSSKKLEAQRREMEQLQVSLTSAQIFFKRTDVDT